MKFRIFAVITFLLLSYALYQGMWVAPREATMGEIQRIFYYHMPSALTSFLCLFANFIASIFYLARRDLKADAFAVSTAEVGVVFCTVVLVTGPLWARPVWGIWWTWDARLTTTLVLWLIYVSYLILRRYSVGQATPTLAAALAIFGFIDVPICYMSIRWWRTQHPQPVIVGGQGSGLDPRMWTAVLWNWVSFMALAALLIWVRYRLEIVRQQLDEAHALKAVGRAEGSFAR